MQSPLPRRALLAAPLLLAFSAFAADPPAPPKGQRVFLAGHSFLMPTVAPLTQVAAGAKVADHKLAGTQSIGGSTVTQHWDRADEMNKAKEALKAKQVDVLILSPHLMVPDPAIDKFTALLLENNPDGRVLLQVSWYPFDARLADRKTFKNADRDDAKPAELRKTWAEWGDRLRAQAKAVNATHAAAKRPVVFLVPVGSAVIGLREKVVKGEVPGVAKQSELFRDEIGHGTPVIAVLAAYCHHGVIYGRSPVGLPVPDALKAANLGVNAEKVNRILQELAWEAVKAEPGSGVGGG